MHKERTLTIEKVTDLNFDVFLSLVNKLAEYEKLDPPNQEAKLRLRQDCLSQKPKFTAYLGAVDSKPVAYIVYFFTYSSFLALPTLFLEDIFVLEEHRRNEVGKKMFDFVKQQAKSEGCGRIEFTVLKWNTSAQKFYEKNGAKRLDWFFYRVFKEDF